MREFVAFFGEFIVIIAVAGMLYGVVPDGSQKKYVQFAISLSVLASLMGPMISVVSDLPDMLREIEWSAEADRAFVEQELSDDVVLLSEEKIERSVEEHLIRKFGLQRENLEVDVVTDASDLQAIRIERVEIRLRNVSAMRRQEIKMYVQSLFLEQSEIVISDKEKS